MRATVGAGTPDFFPEVFRKRRGDHGKTPENLQ